MERIFYLYKKTHRITGLQYLGKTSRKNPFKYRGSGIDWLSHIIEYGNKVDTEILLETTDLKELKNAGRYYSNLWNVVDSPLWANRIPETGGGTGIPFEDLPKQTCRYCYRVCAKKHVDYHEKYCRENPSHDIKTYSKVKCTHCNNLYPKNAITQHISYCHDNPERIDHHNTNRTHSKKECPHCLKLVGIQSNHLSYCYKNPDRTDWPRTGHTGKQAVISCQYCSALGGASNMSRYHNNNCHMNPDSVRYNPTKKIRSKKT
jgi:hypothetical protein